jgi:hypothetical protein
MAETRKPPDVKFIPTRNTNISSPPLKADFYNKPYISLFSDSKEGHLTTGNCNRIDVIWQHYINWRDQTLLGELYIYNCMGQSISWLKPGESNPHHLP